MLHTLARDEMEGGDLRRGGAPIPSFLGTGLDPWGFAAVVLVTTTVFLFWNGPLWRAPAGASHLGRILVSYLLAVPLVAVALAARRGWSVGRLLTGVALVWSAKLAITATLYAAVAPESASRYAPTLAWEAKSSRGPATDAVAVATVPSSDVGHLAGSVVRNGEGVPRAAVVVEGIAVPIKRDPVDVDIVIEHARYRYGVYLASSGDRIVAVNHDSILHTLRILADGRALANMPVPAGTLRASMPVPDPGVYEITCQNHASERSSLVVVDHPFATLTGETGRFEIGSVPAGERRLLIVTNAGPPSRRDVRIATARDVDVPLELEGEGK